MADTHVEWQNSTVLECTQIAAGIRRIVLEPSNPIAARPGEHIDVIVELDEGQQGKRSYSIVGANSDGTRIAISVFLAPQSRGGSEFMHTLQLGDTLRITLPLQDFPLRVGAPSYVLVAGGVGITAIRGMASLLKRLGADYTLHYIGRSRERMAYLTELEAAHHNRLVLHVTEESGRMSVETLLETVPENAELYMCGPIRLMESIRRNWEQSDRDITALRYETFGNSGWFDAEPFEVEIPQYDMTIQVSSTESMLEALERSGVDIMSDCRRGECGLCEMRILGLNGNVDHRDVFYSERQKAPNSKMCGCVSRIVAHAPDEIANNSEESSTDVDSRPAQQRTRVVVELS